MYSNNRTGNRAPCARGFAALWIVLAMGLALGGTPAEAAPFAYVTNSGFVTVSVIDTATTTVVGIPIPVGCCSPEGVAVTPDGKHAYVVNDGNPGTISVIDTATNTVVATVAVGIRPRGVAVTPDGKHAYVTNFSPNNVSVIDTATDKVVATVVVGNEPLAVAVTPDGKHAYVTNQASANVSVIDTAINIVVGTPIPVGTQPFGVAINPDGKHAYVANSSSNNVSVIATATNSVAATIPVGSAPFGVAFTPDGKHAYVVNNGSNNVSIISTALNTVVATVSVGIGPELVAVTPDGKHAYVANNSTNNVSVIATATNKVVATVMVGGQPVGVGIIPPPPGVPFLAFGATTLQIGFGAAPNQDTFNLHSLVTLSSTAKKGINPLTHPVTFQVGTFTTTIPSGSFTKAGNGSFTFAGVIGGVSLQVVIRQAATLRYRFNARATSGASLTGTKNPVYVTLIIGGYSGATSVTAGIQGHPSPL